MPLIDFTLVDHESSVVSIVRVFSRPVVVCGMYTDTYSQEHAIDQRERQLSGFWATVLLHMQTYCILCGRSKEGPSHTSHGRMGMGTELSGWTYNKLVRSWEVVLRNIALLECGLRPSCSLYWPLVGLLTTFFLWLLMRMFGWDLSSLLFLREPIVHAWVVVAYLARKLVLAADVNSS